jgi:hypothetical protein
MQGKSQQIGGGVAKFPVARAFRRREGVEVTAEERDKKYGMPAALAIDAAISRFP